ncbi:MAG: hypothetical protein ACRDQY_25970 [Pseudonocardiaceae bacterium]
MWVADDDPYLGAPNPSPLTKAEQFSVWDPIPFGQDARERRIVLCHDLSCHTADAIRAFGHPAEKSSSSCLPGLQIRPYKGNDQWKWPFALFRGGGQGRGRTADLPIFSSKST